MTKVVFVPYLNINPIPTHKTLLIISGIHMRGVKLKKTYLSSKGVSVLLSHFGKIFSLL